MGAAAFADVRTKEKISHDPEANARVQRVGARIAEAVGDQLPSAKWEFVVFDAPKTINAFALPGGKVGVYTGLLNLAKTDDELAGIEADGCVSDRPRHPATLVRCHIGSARPSTAVAVCPGCGACAC